VLSIGLNRAVVLIAEPSKGRFGKGASAGKPLGEHPEDGKPVSLNSGRFGPYVKWGKVMATVTKAYDPENLTLAQAVEIIIAKAAKVAEGGGGGGGKPMKGKKSAKTASVKEAPAKEVPAQAKKSAPTKKVKSAT